MTGREMCELISQHWKDAYNIDTSPESIWRYSPTGELAMIWFWYNEAKEYYDSKAS